MLYFSAEADLQKGKKVTLPTAPPELIYLRYREHFHITWREFLDTPWDVIQRDLEILSIEGEVLKSKQESKHGRTH